MELEIHNKWRKINRMGMKIKINQIKTGFNRRFPKML
jgi:hypothetical protein